MIDIFDTVVKLLTGSLLNCTHDDSVPPSKVFLTRELPICNIFSRF